MTLKTLNYGNYGIFLIMGNAGFCPIGLSWGIITSPHHTTVVACNIETPHAPIKVLRNLNPKLARNLKP